MNIANIVNEWKNKLQDPVKDCKIYKIVGCAHVDGMLCDMKTCDVNVLVNITPNTVKTIDL